MSAKVLVSVQNLPKITLCRNWPPYGLHRFPWYHFKILVKGIIFYKMTNLICFLVFCTRWARSSTLGYVMLFGCLNLVKPSVIILMYFIKKSLISLTNERIYQKTFGARSEGLNPMLAIVAYSSLWHQSIALVWRGIHHLITHLEISV